MQPGQCRVIGIIDVDSFECPIWENKNPQYKDRSCIVTNAGGRILSVTHEAKELGITRDLKMDEAKIMCPGLNVFEKPDKFNTNSSYSSEPRSVSNDIQYCIFKFCINKRITIGKVPMDERYLELTQYVEDRIAEAKNNERDPIPGFYEDEVGSNMTLESPKWLNVNELLRKMEYLERKFPKYTTEEQPLVIGAGIMDEVIENIYDETEFVCSGGVSCNTPLEQQALTILSSFGLERVSQILETRNIHGLESNFGQQVSIMLPGVRTMWDLKQLEVNQLTNCYDFELDDTEHLYDVGRVVCNKDVTYNVYTDSVNCVKNNLRIKGNGYFRHSLGILCYEMMRQLDEEFSQSGRLPTSMKIIFSYIYEDEGYDSEATIERSLNYSNGYHAKYITQECFMEIRNWGFNPNDNDGTIITKLTVSAKGFYFA